MPQTIIDLLKKGAEANNMDSWRKGNLVCLPDNGSMVVTGDIHGHRRNFERIKTFADLSNNPDRHIILQEIIHGGPEDCEGDCTSYNLLFDVVRYKLEFPNQIHIIMGNHDTCFINDSEILKAGKEMNISMNLALERQFEQKSNEIKVAIRQFLLSEPLAVKCENRIWISHSLPSDRYVEQFDKQILDRELKEDDLVKPGAAYLLTWGRRHSQAMLNKMAQLFDIDIFILGHQMQKHGWGLGGENLIIITSEHNHGSLVAIDLAKSYTISELIDLIIPLASIS